MLHTPVGVEPQGATLAEMDLGMMGVGGDEALLKEKQMIDAATSIPGVMAAGTVNFTPLSGAGMRGIPIYRQGTADMSLSNQVLGSRVYPVSPGYFAAAGTQLRSGRSLTWADDDERRPRAAIVNETFARKLYGAASAVGQHFLMWDVLYEVVGVAEDGKYGDLTESPEGAVYTSSPQMEQSNVILVVRSRLQENEIRAQLQRTLEGIEPGMPIKIESWQDALSNVLFPARTAAAALGVMGMLAVTGDFWDGGLQREQTDEGTGDSGGAGRAACAVDACRGGAAGGVAGGWVSAGDGVRHFGGAADEPVGV
jgi:hypothetical protein